MVSSNARRWLALAVLSLSMLITVVDTTIVNVALPTLAVRLHASASALEWIVDAYTLSFAALLLPAGSAGDRFGRRRALIAGMALFGAASLGAALAPGASALTAWRAVMGAGAALVIPASMATLVVLFPAAAERAKAIAVWSGTSALGVAAGPTLGGWLLAHFAWGSIFAVNLPVAAVALIGAWFAMPPSGAQQRPRFDLAGMVLAAAASATLTYTIIEAGTEGWTGGTAACRWALSVLLIIAFVAWEARAPDPMINLGLFRDPRFAVASGAVATLFFGLAGSTFLLTQIYQFVLGYSPLAAGIRSLPSAVALAIAVPAGTRLAARAGISTSVTAGLLAMAAGLIYLALARGDTPYSHYVVAATVMAIGTGLTTAPATQSVLASLPPALLGAGSAVNNAMRNFGSVLGVAVLGSLAATFYARSLPAAQAALGGHPLQAGAADAFVRGVSLGAFGAAGLTIAVAATTAWLLPNRPHFQEESSAAQASQRWPGSARPPVVVVRGDLPAAPPKSHHDQENPSEMSSLLWRVSVAWRVTRRFLRRTLHEAKTLHRKSDIPDRIS